MLVQPHQLFLEAMVADYAIGAFNASNMEIAQAIIAAAHAKKSPVIVQTSEGALEYAGVKTLSGIIRSIAEAVRVPVVLHLDHGKSLEIVEQCIEEGYTSVMIDASSKSLDENIALTKRVVQYAHERSVWVEGELGSILGMEGAQGLKGAQTPDDLFTRPTEAKRFVNQTGVDALAVSVGTIHGAFTGQEYIRFELLEQLSRTLPNMPLVLHGASGIADAHLRRAVSMHVCKVNVDTELRIAFDRAVRAYVVRSHDMVDPRDMLSAARDAVQGVVEKKIELLGSSKVAYMYR